MTLLSPPISDLDAFDGALDEPESVFKRPDKLERDDILFERLLGLGDALGQIEKEVLFANPLSEVDQFADELLKHRRFLIRHRRVVFRATAIGDPQAKMASKNAEPAPILAIPKSFLKPG